MRYQRLIVSIRNTRILFSLNYKGWQGTGALRVRGMLIRLMGKIDADIEYFATMILRITSIHIFYSMIKILVSPQQNMNKKYSPII
jgi:hypothetical protein